jgi:ribosomal protein S18 acetylase RimI-like enzyme
VIVYQDTLGSIGPDDLRDFFVGWPRPPSSEKHAAVLANSNHIVLAIDDSSGDLVGFITALSDGVMCAYISFLEVVPTHRRQGIGSELVRRMLAKLRHLYAVDLLCDPELQSFYARFGMTTSAGMGIRRPTLIR